MLHKNIGLTEIHRIHNWEYADSTVRLAASGLTSSDIGKVAWQKDNDTYWVLKTTSPLVWITLGKDGSPVTSLDFNTATTATDAVGRVKWNDTDGTIEVGLKGGQTTLQVGQEVVKRIYNNTGSTLVDGQVVYITGAQGSRPTVALADADIEAKSSRTIGVVTETIPNSSEGFITVFGYVRGLNTSAFNEGDPLYLSGTPGVYTNLEPVPPMHRVSVGFVIRKNPTDGSIFISVNNGYELDELHDVLISGIQNNQYLKYDSASGLWKNVNPSISDVTNLQTTLDSKLTASNIGVTVQPYNSNTVVDSSYVHTDNNFTTILKTKLDDLNAGTNIATLVDGKVPSAQLPSYVDDVLEFSNIAAFPAVGEQGKIYITIDTNLTYRWTGSVYSEIGDGKGVWGAIVGDISNQTDLSNALAAKVAKVTSVDNAVVRFDGTTGEVQSSSVYIDDNDNLLIGTTTNDGVNKLQVNGGASVTSDISLPTASSGIILTSPNGTKYKLTVDNDGSLTTTAV